ncbi:MAG TPA: AMP-binding protein, partial [Cellulomonas sp.]|uniref:class I adenylate-forming enzyme family protein n=1 Tax=Cellulomonas sp. TaxID=40001 RepID=UPI002E308E19
AHPPTPHPGNVMNPDLSPATALAQLARRQPETVSVVADDGTVLTASRLHDATVALAGRLAAGGVQPGDRVVYAGRNSPAALLTLLASAHLGAVYVPLNFRLAPAEVRLALDHCTPHALVVEEELAALYSVAGRHVPVSLTAHDAAGAAAPAVVPPRRVLEADDLAVIMYTSGTSGRPKGVMLTHGNLWWSQRNIDEVFDTRRNDVTLAVAPMFHIGGLNAFTLRTLLHGGTVVLRRTFDAERTLDDLASTTITSVFGVPAMYAAVARCERFATADLSGVRAAIIGGAPTPAGLLESYRARGLILRPSWGMTELAPAATYLPTPCLTSQPGSVGVPLPYTRIRVVSPDTGEDVRGPGLPGELWVAGPQVTPGYWQDEEATRAALTPDGWLRSGDLAVRDADGCLTLVGRCAEAINTGGEKVVPGEVERSLDALAGVSEVVVVGAPDPAWGETVVAVLECADTVTPTLAEVRELAALTIARFKLPTRILRVGTLPRTATGKVDRCAVKALAASAAED